mgnify:CR=1 FL=1|tara:strand:- start:17462 stop:17995 length:534 start_codon:yes stop_codon:yes gene_type:complete
MKLLKVAALVLVITLTSCSSLRVLTDYDTKVDFKKYKTFAFYKKGIDKAKVSDLDKKRIMRAIEKELLSKGFTKSKDPDMLVSIFTKSREKVNVTNNNFGYGFGWGYNPWFYGQNNLNVRQYTEGTLFIDFIDKEKNELIWQGIGSGAMRMSNPQKKEARVSEFVNQILSKYPPDSN